MRKKGLLCLCLLALCLWGNALAAESAVILPSVQIQTAVPTGWTTVTPENAQNHTALLGTPAGVDPAQRMRDEGIAFTAYGPSRDVRMQILYGENDETRLYFDIERYTAEMRKDIRAHYLDKDAWGNLRYSEAEWKNTSATGRLLRLTYTVRQNDEITARGLAAYTVRNGRGYLLQIQAEGRRLTSEEQKQFEAFVKATQFTPQLEMPLLPVGLTLTTPLPGETLGETFKLRGETAPGATVTAAISELGGPPTLVGEAVAKNSGSFTLEVTLPGKGAWDFAVDAMLEGFETSTLTSRLFCDPDRIPILLNTPLEGEVLDAQPELSGTTLAGTTLTAWEGNQEYTAKAASDGSFRIKLAQDITGERSLEVLFTHPDMPDRRETYAFTRQWRADDYEDFIADQVTKLSYKNLTGDPKKYMDRLVKYTGLVREVSQNGDKVYMRVAVSQGKNGEWEDEVIIVDHGEAEFIADDIAVFYGTVTGNTHSYSLPPTAENPNGGTLLLPELLLVLAANP